MILGHVDSRRGPGVFFPLAGVMPGTEVHVDRADGSTVTFHVTGVLTVAKAGFPTEQVYAPTLQSSLRLVTCGGPFDHAAGSYRDNVIVSADPVAVAAVARSRSPPRCSCWLVLLACWVHPAALAQPPLVVVPAGVVDGQVRLVVEVPDGAGRSGPKPSRCRWTACPAPAATAQPVLSDRLALGLVVDASADGGPMLPVGLGGAANLVLTAPSSTRGALVTDSTPPAVAVPWPSAQAVMLRGLSAVQPGGARSTAAALDLAVAQLRSPGTDPRLVVLYTGAPDAGGEPAASIAERMRAAGVLLAVVCPSTGTPAETPSRASGRPPPRAPGAWP